MLISERSTKEKKTDNKLTGLVLLHRGELKGGIHIK